jgi:hypothetical protein
MIFTNNSSSWSLLALAEAGVEQTSKKASITEKITRLPKKLFLKKFIFFSPFRFSHELIFNFKRNRARLKKRLILN